MAQELIAISNIVFLAFVVTLVGQERCRWVPDYSADTDRLAIAIRASEEESQRRGECVVYVAVTDGAE